LNLKEVLGLGNFRLQSFEAIQSGLRWHSGDQLAAHTAMLAYRPYQLYLFGRVQTTAPTGSFPNAAPHVGDRTQTAAATPKRSGNRFYRLAWLPPEQKLKHFLFQ
jgi:hypothetical protein